MTPEQRAERIIRSKLSVEAKVEAMTSLIGAIQSGNCACAWTKSYVGFWGQIAWCRAHGPEAKQ